MGERSVPVQVLFANPDRGGVVVDCLLAGSISGPAGALRAGEPFSLLVRRHRADPEEDQALAVLQRWSEETRVVQATVDDDGGCLVLRSARHELHLDLR